MSELIKISKEFKGFSGGLWLGREVTIQEGQDPIAVFLKENELLEKAYMAMNQQINWASNPQFYNLGVTIPSEEKERPIGLTVDDINSCQDKITLESYRLLVRNKPELEAAFLSKLKEFI